jgi:glycosyltransferase involved in cell wall biosynthesis
VNFETLAVWLGFNFRTSMKREGISRFLYYLIKHLSKNYQVNIEIWCYDCNYSEVSELFSELLSDEFYRKKLRIITETTYKSTNISRWIILGRSFQAALRSLYDADISGNRAYLNYREHIRCMKERKRVDGRPFNVIMNYIFLPLDMFLSCILLLLGYLIKGLRITLLTRVPLSAAKGKDYLLEELANKYSQAECMLIANIVLDNALAINIPKVVFVPDLVTLEFRDFFIRQDPATERWIEHGRITAESFGKQQSYFCGISKYGVNNQLLKYIKNADELRTLFIYLASMVPDNIFERVLNRNDILSKYRISLRYIFYPTQIRPYKNIIVLLKSLKSLIGRGINLQIVLTGQLESDVSAYAYARENNLLGNIILCGSLPEVDLYSLYYHAEMMISPSLFEGGFPLQALEALLMDTPVIMARIPVTVERLIFEGFDPVKCGVKLFRPEDDEDLTSRILEVLNNREKALAEQHDVKTKMLSYTWNDVSRQYYELFSKIAEGQ